MSNSILWDVWTVVNPNAHNVRYGRDCRAPAVVEGQVTAGDELAAMEIAHEEFGYCPDKGQYELLVVAVTIATGVLVHEESKLERELREMASLRQARDA